MSPILELQDVTRTFGEGSALTHALRGVSLDVRGGEAVALMGPSGCGKTTLLNVMGLVVAASSGSVVIDGRAISSHSDRGRARLRNRTFGYVRQDFALIDEDTAGQNVEIPLLCGAAGSGARRAGTWLRQAFTVRGSTSRSGAACRRCREESANAWRSRVPSWARHASCSLTNRRARSTARTREESSTCCSHSPRAAALS